MSQHSIARMFGRTEQQYKITSVSVTDPQVGCFDGTKLNWTGVTLAQRRFGRAKQCEGAGTLQREGMT